MSKPGSGKYTTRKCLNFHHRGLDQGPTETSRTSQHYSIEKLKGLPQLGGREDRTSQTGD